MLALINRFVRLFNKEKSLLTNYERSHPHFGRYLALDALLSIALVFGGFHLFASPSSDTEDLKHAGVVALSSSEFIEHVKHDGFLAYWLGPIPGYKYEDNDSTPGIADVFYLPEGADPTNEKLFLYEVKTYKDEKIWDAHTHSSLATLNTTAISIGGGITIKINKSSMKGEIMTRDGTPEITAIAFPKPQTLQAMIDKAKELVLVQ